MLSACPVDRSLGRHYGIWHICFKCMCRATLLYDEPEVCVFSWSAVFFLALFMLTYLFYFSLSSFPFSISIWTSFVSSCPSLVGAMLSPRFRFLVRLYQHMIFIRTYADLTFLFQSVVYDLFQLLCELSSVSHLFSS